jgi:hypothetical protein
LRHTAPSARESDSLVVTHPFHPLVGQRIPILGERHGRSTLRHVYVCDGGALGVFYLPEGFTDRADLRAATPLTVESLTTVAAIVAALPKPLTTRKERRTRLG